MKNTILFTTAAAATGAAIILYLLRKKKSTATGLVQPKAAKSHHLTNIFSNAKENTDHLRTAVS